MLRKTIVHSKLPTTGTSIFTVMSALATETGAINLSQGFPDFMCNEELMRLANFYVRKGYNQYAPMPGIFSLREAIAEKVNGLYKITFDPLTEITITPGGTEAIYAAITAVVDEGDEVIIFEPAYDSYLPGIVLNKGIPVCYELHAPDYRIDWNTVRKLMNPRTKMIIINTPHNPTGTVLTREDMMQLERITNDSNIIILSDEVYEHIIFDGQQHESVLRYPSLAERSFVVFSFGKTYHNTGWKMGYCLAPENLMKEFRRVHQFIVFSANTPYQHAFAELMKNKNLYLELNHFYQGKRNKFLDLIKNSRFRMLPSAGTYFQLLSYDSISDEKDTDIAIRLTKEYGVASIPVSAFYHRNIDYKMLRFCFAKSDETLERAAEKLCRI